jgi:hypothetical protein
MPTKDRLREVVTFIEPGNDDVTYTHAVFAQCFLPIRKLPNGGKFYEVRHGRAALLIDAGRLLNPADGRLRANGRAVGFGRPHRARAHQQPPHP